jgi:hypothetical protein
MMMKLLLSSLLLGLVPLARGDDFNNVGLPSITFDLRSNAEGDLRDVIVEVLESSRSHLKQQFRSHFEEEEGKSDYFQYLDLSVKQYDVGGERHLAEYSMAILYHGVAYFNRAPPDKSLAYDIVAEAFQGDLREQFVTALLESKSPFLSQLQYIVVTINDLVVANDDLSHRVSTSQDSSSSTSWLVVLAVAGSAFGVLVALAILIHIWYLNRSKNFLELPKKYGANKDEFHDELEMKSTSSPSPEKSIISQESSKFTYNPRSFSESPTLPSQFSGLEVDSSQPINVEGWQKGAISPITPVPFGADISAIEVDLAKDLSILEECTSSQERSSSAESSGVSDLNYLTKNSLTSLANMMERSAEPPRRVTAPNIYSMSTDDSNVLSEISLNDDGSDIISELKKLSVQFQQHRASYR